MKKIYLVALGVVLSFALVGSAYAIDGASLESQTTEGLYDRNDAFDITLRPGLLYQVDRWRLYTNLSGYEKEDSYLIGTSGQLGPGSMAFFYETNKYEDDDSNSYRLWEYDEDMTPMATDDDYPNYDGRWDQRWEWADSRKYELEREEHNFYASYSMDFGAFSLGLSYAPEFWETERTYSINENGPDEWSDIRDGFDPKNYWGQDPFWACAMYFPTGSNWTSYYYYRDYGEVNGDEYDEYDEFTGSTAWNGEQDRDTDVHPIYLESQIHTADHWHLLAGVGYADIQVDTDFDGRLVESREWLTSYDTGDTLTETWNREIRVNGALLDDFDIYDADLDGDRWWIYLEPVYEVNDIVTLRMDLHYADEDGDLDKLDGFSGTMVASYEIDDSNSDIPRWEAMDTFNATASGDYEVTEWGIEPRVYFNYDPVRFSLGVGYHYEETEWDGRMQCAVDMDWMFDDGDSEDDDSDDWRFQGSYSESMDFDGKEEITVWRFPVAAEFDVTEKFMVRAGAAYYRQDIEYERTVNYTGRNDEEWTFVDGAGDPIEGGPGPNQYFEESDSDAEPYDDDQETAIGREDYDETRDWVTYNIGCGYAFTENLQLDLMWERGSGDHVDFDRLFTSITLAF